MVFSQKTLVTIVCVLSLLTIGVIWNRFSSPPKGSFSKSRDIYHIYQDASLLAQGENPYSRIATGNSKKNEKYTFYLPGFLLFASATISLGFTNYQEWMPYWLFLSLMFHVGIAALLYLLVHERAGSIAGIAAALFWMFSRWPLALLRSGQIDALPIFFFILSLFFIRKNIVVAAAILSVSLAIKQVAALTAPLYLWWAYSKGGSREAIKTLIALCLLPGLLSLPFIIWDPQSFIAMILFPLTREPMGARSVDIFLGLPPELSKLPFLSALALSYFLVVKKKLSDHGAIFFIIMVTLSFNPVFFSRYFCWAVPLIPIICFQSEWRRDNTQNE